MEGSRNRGLSSPSRQRADWKSHTVRFYQEASGNSDNSLLAWPLNPFEKYWYIGSPIKANKEVINVPVPSLEIGPKHCSEGDCCRGSGSNQPEIEDFKFAPLIWGPNPLNKGHVPWFRYPNPRLRTLSRVQRKTP